MKQNATGETIALIITLAGAFAMGLVHNPKTLLLGLITIPLGLGLMWSCGYKRGRSKS